MKSEKKHRTPTKTSAFKKNSTFKYYFNVEDAEVEVCKTFFLNTLSINEITVTTAMEENW